MDFRKILQYTNGLNVLYVEDDENLLEETSDILEDYFLELTTAVNGKEALEKYNIFFEKNGYHYDLIITDINMPIMCGNILIDEVYLKTPEQNIIVISAYNEADKLITLIQKGISNFLLKPVDPEQFINTLYRTCKSIVAHKQMQTDNQILTNTNIGLDGQVIDLTSEILAIKRLSVETIINLIESYDDDTGSHVKRIESYTDIICKSLKDIDFGYSEDLKELIPFASLLHDTGKFMIPKSILSKPDKLTIDERKIMETHAEIGGKILAKANRDFKKQFNKDSYFKVASDIAYFHHEKWNGTGYPKGLKKYEIPLSARIVAIVDVYDALRSKRSYKNSFSHEQSLSIIEQGRKIAFDPELVDIFLKHHLEFNSIFLKNQDN